MSTPSNILRDNLPLTSDEKRPLVKASRQRLSPEARREQLLQGAVTAYAQLGVERAGHGDIAKLVGASTATVFNYFPTRKDLTQAVFDTVSAQVFAVFEGIVSETDLSKPVGVPSVQANFLRLIQAYDQLIESHTDTAKVLLNWSVSFGTDVRPAYLEFQASVIERLAEVTGDSSPHLTDSRIVYGAALTYSILKLDQTPEESLAEFVARVVEMVMRPHVP